MLRNCGQPLGAGNDLSLRVSEKTVTSVIQVQGYKFQQPGSLEENSKPHVFAGLYLHPSETLSRQFS